VSPTPIILVTGPPASGKTTLAERIARELRLPLIAKDVIKETLFDAFGTRDREWSIWLGRATYALIFRFLEVQLAAGRSVVVDATFGPEIANLEFETLKTRYPFSALQIFCFAPNEVLYERYTDRAAERHPGHVDSHILDEIKAQLEENRWQPLDVGGETINVDTSDFDSVDFEGLVKAASRHLG
jgi:predicted kinase